MNMKGLNTTGGITTEYRYNVDGLRTGKKVGNTWTRYFWDGDRIISDNQSGTYVEAFIASDIRFASTLIVKNPIEFMVPNIIYLRVALRIRDLPNFSKLSTAIV